MNNIKKKNILYKLDTKNILPHTGKGDSIVFASNSNITNIKVNNALQQLINNDLYLENKILHEMKYQAGPEYIQNIDQLSALPNGSKRWVDSNDYTQPLQINRKIEEPLSASIYEVRNQPVNFIISIGDNIFIAFADKLMYDNGSDLIDCKDNNGNDIVAIGYYTCTDGTFFITETSLYELKQNINDIYNYSLIKIDIGDLNNLRCVTYDSTNNMFYIGGTNSYMARGFYDKTNNKVDFISDIKFCQDDVYGQNYETYNYLSNVTVNAIQLLDNTENSINKDEDESNILAATDIGIFRSDSRYYLNTNSFIEFNNKTCVGIVENIGELYILASDGYLYIKTNNGFQKYTDKYFPNPKALILHSSEMYIACDAGIYKYTQFDKSEPELEYDNNVDSIAIESLDNKNKIVFAAKDNIIYYYNNPVIIKNFQIDENYKIIQILLQPRKNEKYIYDLYILANDITTNNNYVFAAYIEFNSTPEYDQNKIYQLNSIIDNCDIITSYNDNCYYIKNNIIYNLTTGFNKSLDDLKVSCIDYSVDNNCIVLGTNIGLYILDPVTFEIKDILDDNNLTNIKHIAQSKDIIYFSTDSILYAVAITENKQFKDITVISNISSYPEYIKFNGIQTYNDNLYTLLNSSDNIGPILTSQPYYVRYTTSTINNTDEGENLNVVNSTAFPLMSAITEINISSAIGISAGIPYKLEYNPINNEYSEIKLSGITISADPVKAICTAGRKLFVAAGQNIYQYECSADIENFDLNDLSAMVPSISSNVDFDVKKLLYSGTDLTFDARIYAQTDNGLFVHSTGLNTNKKLTTNSQYTNFIQYTDSIEYLLEDNTEVKNDYYIFLGITDLGKLEVNIATISNDISEWTNTSYEYSFNDISGENPQFDRKPYDIMCPDNSRIYVAYTAKLSNDNYVDCIAAITTDSILCSYNNPEFINTSDFYIIGNISGPNDGQVRFSGFSLSRLIPEEEKNNGLDNEDIDIITIYTRDNNINKLLTFKVDSNIENQSFANTVNITIDNLDDLALSYFQPDCFSILKDNDEQQNYIILPAKVPNGDLQIELYKYNGLESNNNCIWTARYYIENIDSTINIKDIFVIGSPIDSIEIIEFLIVTSDNNTYTIKANKNLKTQWSNNNFILSGFNNIKRFSINQLIGYSNNFAYDFQTSQMYNYQDISIKNVFFTDNGESDDFIFVQDDNKNIYVTEPDNNTEFNKIDQFNDINFSLTKVNNHLFVIDQINEKIYKEKNGSFEEIARGNFNINYIDSCICYDNNIYYLCILQSDNIMNIYQIDDIAKDLIKKYTFENVPAGYIPFIVSNSEYSGINQYLRHTLFINSSIQHYNWPFIAELNNTGNFNYLDFDSDFQLKFKELTIYKNENYLRIDKNNSFLYGVYNESFNTVITSIIDDINLPGTNTKYLKCDINSSNGWFSGNIFFFKTDNGLRYYNNEWNTIPNSIGDYINIVNNENNYYFLKIDNEIKNLYINTKEKSFNLKINPILYKIEDEINNPIQLVNSNNYTGLICLNNVTKIQTLYILKPNIKNIIIPSITQSNDLVNDNSFIYFILVSRVQFEGLPNNTNIYNIVPIGNSINELIIYDNNYLYSVQLSKNLLDNDIIKININNTLPWSEYNIIFNFKIISSIKYNNIKYIANENGLFTFSDKSLGLVMKIINPAMKISNINTRSFYKIGQNNFYIPTNNGIYRYLQIDNISNINRITPPYDIKQIISYNFSGLADTYLIVNAFDNFIYQSENGRIWKKQFKPIPVGSFNTIYPKNIREWYFGGNTGLYKSIYQYKEVNDIKKFTETDLYSLYNNLISSNISNSIEDTIINHEVSESFMLGHLNSLVDNINNNLLSVNFNGLQTNGWQKSNNDMSNYKIQNDIVFEQYWGNNIDNNIALSVENQFVTTSNAKFTYLFRRWMSGITEIYINIPTTNTYYINHLPSTPNYNIDEDSTELTASNVSQFGKAKQIFRHDPNKPGVYTKMSLALNKSIFNINLLIGVQACGNSLPLKIYKENINENISDNDYKAAQYFNSYIAPTVMISQTENQDSYIFEFACFGTDEQVIKLEFIDNINKFNDSYCRLIFNSNGLNSNAESFVKQRIRLDKQKYKLRRNVYKWPDNQKIFIGWTFTPYPQDNPDTSKLNGFYCDAYEITSTEIQERIGAINQEDDVILYAVWITYQFTNNDTTLLLNSSVEKNMLTIGNVEIVNNTNIKDKVIVKFEEIES